MHIVKSCKNRLLAGVLSFAVLLSAVPTLTLQASAAGEHTHCLCGKTHTSIGDHTAAESITFTEWTDPDKLPWESGCYYLTKDYNLTTMWALQSGKDITLCLNGHTIKSDNFDIDYNSVISIQSGSKLTIVDCKGSGTVRTHKSNIPAVKVYNANASVRIFGGTYTGKDTGLYIDAGNADIYGGTFKGNANYGIFLCRSLWPSINKTTVNLYNATIQGNGSRDYLTGSDLYYTGGGICVQSDCTLNMYNGTISGNYGNTGGGVINMGTFNMSDGTIQTNNAKRGGGVANYGTFTMAGGNIGSNTAEYGGGVYSINDSRSTDTVFTLSNDSTIQNNNASYGGGIACSNRSSNANSIIRMTGGIVRNNTASACGGGIFSTRSNYNNTLELSGGSIIDNKNTTTESDCAGGGVYAPKNTTLQLQGNITVSGNTRNGEPNNIYLRDRNQITVPAALIGGSIGVSIPGANGTVAKGSSYQLTESDKRKFQSDADGYEFVLNANTIKLQKILTPVVVGDFTFTPPTDLTYNGEPKAAMVTGKSGIGNITLKYYDTTGRQLTGAPVDAGSYTVKIDVAESDEYAAITNLTDATWKFTITPKNLAKNDVTMTGVESFYIYNGSSIRPVPTVVYGDKTLVQDTDYTVSYGDNVRGTCSLTIHFQGNYAGTADYTFEVDYGTLDDTMYTMPTANENGWYNQALTVNAKTGYTVGLSTTAFADSVQLSEVGKDKSVTFYAKSESTGSIYKGTLVYSLDDTAPSDLEIQYNNSVFRKLMNTFTFGIFFKETVTVNARATDTLSGVDTVRYYAADAEISDPTTIADWSDSLCLTPNTKKIVYVEVTDKAGNRVIANDQGIVLYTDSAAEALNDNFDLNVEKQADVKIHLTLNGNTFSAVKNGTNVLNNPADYTVEGDILTVSKAYLSQFSNGDTVTLSLTFAPLGISGDAVSEAVVTIHVTDTTDYHTEAVLIAYKAPTCENTGHSAYWRCPVCDKYFADNDGAIDTTVTYDTADKFTLPAQSHDFTEVNINDDYLITAATCTKPAVYCYGCTRCDKKDTTKTFKYGGPLGHSFTDYRYNNDATYFVDGTETAACDHDGCTLTDTRPCKNSQLIDAGMPTAAITIGDHTWDTLVSTPVFEQFYNQSQNVTIAYSDEESGVDGTWYFISDHAVDELTSIEWKPYDGAFTVNSDGKYVIYAKVTDKVGNTTIVCSEGLVLDTVAPQLSVKDGAIFCEQVMIRITEEYPKSVTVNGEIVVPEDGTITLTASEEPQVIVVTDKAGNKIEVTVTVNPEHTFTDSEITIPPTVTTEGEKIWYCQYCDATKTESMKKLPPRIIDGANGKFTRGANDGLTFRSNAAFADFLSVAVDGKILDDKNYTLSEGSTIVKLTAAYLNTLEAGTHTLEIQSVSGTATTEFTIAEKQTPGTSPKTGDSINDALWICLATAFLAMVSLTALRRRKKYDR